jgi:hypothetical protein
MSVVSLVVRYFEHGLSLLRLVTARYQWTRGSTPPQLMSVARPPFAVGIRRVNLFGGRNGSRHTDFGTPCVRLGKLVSNAQ